MQRLRAECGSKDHTFAVDVLLYKTRRNMNTCLRARRSIRQDETVLGACVRHYFEKGHRRRLGTTIYLNEQDYTLRVVAHECAHAAYNLLWFRRGWKWREYRSLEESSADICGELVNYIGQNLGVPRIEDR